MIAMRNDFVTDYTLTQRTLSYHIDFQPQEVYSLRHTPRSHHHNRHRQQGAE